MSLATSNFSATSTPADLLLGPADGWPLDFEFDGSVGAHRAQAVLHFSDGEDEFIELRADVSSGWVTEHTLVPKAQADVLFVFDGSCTGNDVPRPAESMHRFFAMADRFHADYRLAAMNRGTQEDFLFLPPHLRPSQRLITPESVEPQSAFDLALRYVDDGHPRLSPSVAAYRGLTQTRGALGRQLMLRPDGRLEVVLFDDNEDYYIDSAARRFAALASLKGWDPTLFGLSTISGGAHGCPAPTGGNAGPSPSYVELTGLGHRNNLDFCADDMREVVDEIGLRAFAPRDYIQLRGWPRPQSISVHVDGRQLLPTQQGPETWRYSRALRRVDFAPAHVPPAGANVTVTYQPDCPPL